MWVEHAGDATPDGASATPAPPASWRIHVGLILGLAFCALAFWFELRRALGGNGLSWAYVFEWPLLAAFAVYAWWKLRQPARRPREQVFAAMAPEFQRMRTAWEEHERALHDDEAARSEGDTTGPTAP
jgi:hypothetical protein